MYTSEQLINPAPKILNYYWLALDMRRRKDFMQRYIKYSYT